MPNVNVTIRRARAAIHLVASGALRDIEGEFDPHNEQDVCAKRDVEIQLFNEMIDELDQWEIASPLVVLELLQKHNLLP